MAALVLHDTSRSPVLSFVPADIDQTAPNTRGKTKLIVDNQGDAPITVSASAVSVSPCGFKHDLTEEVGASEIKVIKLYRELNDPATGEVAISFTDTTSVSVAAFE